MQSFVKVVGFVYHVTAVVLTHVSDPCVSCESSTVDHIGSSYIV